MKKICNYIAKQSLTRKSRRYPLFLSGEKEKKKQEKADTKMLFHVGHLVAPNNVLVRTAETDV